MTITDSRITPIIAKTSGLKPSGQDWFNAANNVVTLHGQSFDNSNDFLYPPPAVGYLTLRLALSNTTFTIPDLNKIEYTLNNSSSWTPFSNLEKVGASSIVQSTTYEFAISTQVDTSTDFNVRHTTGQGITLQFAEVRFQKS